jgi:ferredoxin-NADP reductase
LLVKELLKICNLKDSVIMSSTASATDKHPPSPLPATLVKSEPLSSEARLLTLRVESNSGLEFLAGQCVRIEQELDGKLAPSVYSIASPPCGNNHIELCIKPGRKGSPADSLCALQEGTQVRISAPQGGFVLKPEKTTTLFLAAGTGIAPIRSMIHWLVRKNEGRPICLVYGARDIESLFFHSEFIHFAGRHSNFCYVPVLSRPHENWGGACGYVQHHLHGIAPGEAQAYLCGPRGMVENTNQKLRELGWPEELIHYERNG